LLEEAHRVQLLANQRFHLLKDNTSEYTWFNERVHPKASASFARHTLVYPDCGFSQFFQTNFVTVDH